MDIYTVSFFGHRQIDDAIQIERKLDILIRHLLAEKSFVEFLVGRDGDFDLLVSSVIHRCKRSVRSDHTSLVWVLPYPTAAYLNNEKAYRDYYDEVEICEAARHYKAAFQFRNRSMVDRSDLVICYIDHQSGGAYQTICYAQKRGVPCINICNDKIPDFV